jgi:hypothetical protein
MPVILTTQEPEVRISTVQSQPGQIIHETLFFKKNPTQKRASGEVQAVEHLPRQHEALSSNPSTPKPKHQKKKFNSHIRLMPTTLNTIAPNYLKSKILKKLFTKN